MPERNELLRTITIDVVRIEGGLRRLQRQERLRE
jgi:hypothetical protein